MLRPLALATTAIVAFGAVSAADAACVEAPALDVTCTGATSTPIDDSRDGLSVTIEPGASLSTADRATPPLAMRGDGQVVSNAGTIENTDTRNNTNAIEVHGTGLSIVNDGIISSGDRAIHSLGGSGGLSVINNVGAEILSRRQTIRAEEPYPGASVTNHGTISATDGRALQLRGASATVVNTGTLRGGEEVIEGREGFSVTNTGTVALNGLSWDAATRTWIDSGATADEDGVQFASGTLENSGVILGSDDGIDVDEGTIHNMATGVIVTVGPDTIRDSGAIDVDARFEPSTGSADFRPAGPLSIVNEGYMEGSRGIVTEEGSASVLAIRNSGTIRGRSGKAIELSTLQGDTMIALFGGSRIFGEIVYGAGGTNTLEIGTFTDGATFQSKVDGSLGGLDVVFRSDFALSDFIAYALVADLMKLDVRAGAGQFRLNILGATGVEFGGTRYNPEAFATFLGDNGVAPIPLPATLPLLVAGLGGFAAMRRRRA